MYKAMTTQDIKAITNIVGESRVKPKDQIDPDMAHDELGTVAKVPDLYVQVLDKHMVSEVMTYANEHRIPVTVRGAGTGLVGACVAVKGGILMDMSKMNKIIALDKTNLTLKVEPGVLLLDIYEYVEKEGLFYAPDPGEKTATIAGNISTNAGGMRAIKYGVTRDWVRGLEVVLPNGSIERFGGEVVKNSTGYALKDLMIGSEGTLGIITEATLKLIPKPVAATSLLVPFETRAAAIETAPKLIMNHVLPTAVEYLEQEALKHSESFLGKKLPHNTHASYLLLTYDGNSLHEVETAIEKASDLVVNEYGALDAYLIDTDERKDSVWTVRGGFLEAIKASSPAIDECDVVLPRKEIAPFLAFTRELAQTMNMRIPYFGHVGDGNLHIYLCKDDLDEPTWIKKRDDAFEKLYDKAASMGGLVTGEHGIGYAKRTYMAKQLGETQMALMRGIKQTFDPNNILNPDKVL